MPLWEVLPTLGNSTHFICLLYGTKCCVLKKKLGFSVKTENRLIEATKDCVDGHAAQLTLVTVEEMAASAWKSQWWPHPLN